MNRAEQLRIDAGLTRQDLAKKADVHPTTITRLEANELVGPGRLFAIARVLTDELSGERVKPSELQQPAIFPDTKAAA